MPRQSDSAENKPGEKAMMRKLAVTVFVLSVAALGCGSDSGDKPDTGTVVEAGQKDMAPGPDQAMGTPDMGTDMGSTAEVMAPVDTQMVDTGSVVVPVDGGVDSGSAVDSATGDAPAAVDGGAKLDTAASEAGSVG
jgi:hypothetical protein